jgi:2-iminobutanoate/2-iminopropanoate deaminase
MSTLTRKSPKGAHKPFANYSHVVTAQDANKFVFCAGQVAADPTGKVLPPDDFAAQTKMVMENLRLALAEGGADFKDVVKVTIFICNPHDVGKARAILQDYFGANPPASTLCVLRGLASPHFLLEVEAIAAV